MNKETLALWTGSYTHEKYTHGDILNILNKLSDKEHNMMASYLYDCFCMATRKENKAIEISAKKFNLLFECHASFVKAIELSVYREIHKDENEEQ